MCIYTVIGVASIKSKDLAIINSKVCVQELSFKYLWAGGGGSDVVKCLKIRVSESESDLIWLCINLNGHEL